MFIFSFSKLICFSSFNIFNNLRGGGVSNFQLFDFNPHKQTDLYLTKKRLSTPHSISRYLVIYLDVFINKKDFHGT